MDQLAKIFPQYTVNSVKTSNSKDSIQYTVTEVRSFVESLDKRVYSDQRYLPFYCRAAKLLGFSRVLELQAIATDPSVKQPERMFTYLIKQDYKKRGIV